MIESGFSPRAVSRVGAKGMWQFMEATAAALRPRHRPLAGRAPRPGEVHRSRRPSTSGTSTACSATGSWPRPGTTPGRRAWAGRSQRARTSDFWALTQTRHLPGRDEDVRPADPRRGGDHARAPDALRLRRHARGPAGATTRSPSPERPLDFETIAGLAGVSAEQVRDLNPALLARITPPFGSVHAPAAPRRRSPGSTAALQAAPARPVSRRGACTGSCATSPSPRSRGCTG